MKIKLAVDIGKTRIKIGIFNDNSLFSLKKYYTKEIKSDGNLKSPINFKEWIISQSDEEIAEIVFSISGEINHNNNTIKKSDVLGKSFNGCNFKTLFSPIPTKIYHDGIAASLAYKYKANKESLPFPCLCVSLGTGVAISVVDLIDNNKYQVFDCAKWVNVKIGINEGKVPLHKAIGFDEKSKLNNNERFSNRVIRSINKIIETKYYSRFNYRPAIVFLNGGNVADLNLEKIRSELKVKLFTSINDDEQIVQNMKGMLHAYENNSTIEILVV